MDPSVAERCRTCIVTLNAVVSTLTTNASGRRISSAQARDELERFSLWTGNIGALHPPSSELSIEARLREAKDVHQHVLELLDDLNEVVSAILEIVSGQREGETATEISAEHSTEQHQEEISEEVVLLGGVSACISSLFRASRLVRQAAPTDLFGRALLRNPYRLNDQFDIAYVGEKFPKLATPEYRWLQKRLGRAITQRRHYLSYIQDQRDALEGVQIHDKVSVVAASNPQVSLSNTSLSQRHLPETSGHQSTYFTKASSINPAAITNSKLATEDLIVDDDAKTYTTISRSVADGLGSAAAVKIPKLNDVRVGSRKDFECPFCYCIEDFKNDRVWRRHVFEDLRSYVCTFPECGSLLFGDRDEWFQHEMQFHRVDYKCIICKDCTFSEGRDLSARERYFAHIQCKHPELLDEFELLLQVSRKPVEQIPANSCPMCSDWERRLLEPTDAKDVVSNAHTDRGTVSVLPAIFKRHVAAHLEELALFAVPVRSLSDEIVESNAAFEETRSILSKQSELSSPNSRNEDTIE